MRFLGLNIQYHRQVKYLGKRKTTAPSYIRVFWRSKWVLDIPMPKYGQE
jgi:hypothetical protein